MAKGDWPCLCKLQIGLRMLERHDSAILLGLDATEVQKVRCKAHDDPAPLCGDVSLASKGVWPNLVTVTIVLHCLSLLELARPVLAY